MKVVDIERVVILMRFIQYGWDEKRKKSFDDNLRMMLETQCEDLAEHDKQIRADAERDFQNSDEWNDYLAKIIKDARVDAIEECIEDIRNEFCECDYVADWLEKLKEQI